MVLCQEGLQQKLFTYDITARIYRRYNNGHCAKWHLERAIKKHLAALTFLKKLRHCEMSFHMETQDKLFETESLAVLEAPIRPLLIGKKEL